MKHSLRENLSDPVQLARELFTLGYLLVSVIVSTLISLFRLYVSGSSTSASAQSAAARITAPAASEASVASHYNVLDQYYREIWGSHVHHGLWMAGKESDSVEQATRAMIAEVARWAQLDGNTQQQEGEGRTQQQKKSSNGKTVADVGCGYGGTSRVLAAEYGCSQVIGFTLSQAQAAYARQQTAGSNPEYRVKSWLESDLSPASCDAVVAIESLSHMLDKREAFSRAAAALKPGGRLVLVDWLSAEQPSALARTLLLEPIAVEGHLPELEPLSAYASYAAEAGLSVIHTEDFEQRRLDPSRTWIIVAQRLAKRLLTDPVARKFLLSADNPDRPFVYSLARIPIALRQGSMRLCMLVAEKQ